MEKYCSNCGKKISDSSTFCMNCGVSLQDNISKIENQINHENKSIPGNGMSIAGMVIGILSAFFALISMFMIF